MSPRLTVYYHICHNEDTDLGTLLLTAFQRLFGFRLFSTNVVLLLQGPARYPTLHPWSCVPSGPWSGRVPQPFLFLVTALGNAVQVSLRPGYEWGALLGQPIGGTSYPGEVTGGVDLHSAPGSGSDCSRSPPCREGDRQLPKPPCGFT